MEKKIFTKADFRLSVEFGEVELQTVRGMHVLRINPDGTITLAGSIKLADKRFKEDRFGRVSITKGKY